MRLRVRVSQGVDLRVEEGGESRLALGPRKGEGFRQYY